MLLQSPGLVQLGLIVLLIVLQKVHGVQDIQKKIDGQMGAVIPHVLKDALLGGEQRPQLVDQGSQTCRRWQWLYRESV